MTNRPFSWVCDYVPRTKVKYTCLKCGRNEILPMRTGVFAWDTPRRPLSFRYWIGCCIDLVFRIFKKYYNPVGNCICDTCYRKLDSQKTTLDNSAYQKLADDVEQIYACHRATYNQLQLLIGSRVEFFVQTYNPLLDDKDATQKMLQDKNIGNVNRRKRLAKRHIREIRKSITCSIHRFVMSRYIQGIVKQGIAQIAAMTDSFHEVYREQGGKSFTQIAPFTTPVNWHCHREYDDDQSEILMTKSASLATLPFYRVFITRPVKDIPFPTVFATGKMVNDCIRKSNAINRIYDKYLEILSI